MYTISKQRLVKNHQNIHDERFVEFSGAYLTACFAPQSKGQRELHSGVEALRQHADRAPPASPVY
jgi:hypothetical protein